MLLTATLEEAVMTRFTATPLFFLLVLSASLAGSAAGQEPKKGDAKELPAAPPAPPLAERVEYQFRDGIAKHPLLRFIGPGVESMVATQAQGLRFNVPAGRSNTGEVGVESRRRLRGDFEITLEYELLAQPDPAPKLGAGATLQVLLDTPNAFKARMGRSRRPAGAVFNANYLVLGPEGKENFHGLSAPPANDKETKGHLRMVRTGKMLSYQVEEGGGRFRVIATKEVGLADVIAVQALCPTGGQPVALEVQFPRLELRASEMPVKGAGEIDLAQAERIEYQFRDGFTKQPLLRLMGADVEPMAVVQPEGLRFNIPAGREYTGDVGIESRHRLRGDFEITLEYELVALPKPPPKLGAGAVLQIVLDAPGVSKARMDRLHRPADDVFGANFIINEDFQGLAAAPANGKEIKGQLRMVRTGKRLSYQVQEGRPEFYEIASKEIGLADVVSVQALGATGWQPVALAVRFPRLVLRSNKVGGAIGVEPVQELALAPQAPSGDRSALLIVLGLGAVFSLVVMVGLAVFLWKRRATPFTKSSTHAAPVTQHAVIFTCPDCGKKLKGKPEMAGKQIKCPQCGKLVRVSAGGEEDDG